MAQVPQYPNIGILLPDGQRLNMSLVMKYSVSAAVITFILMGGSTTTYTASNSTDANYVLSQIDSVVVRQTSGTTVMSPTATVNQTGASAANQGNGSYLITITGSGFLSGGINGGQVQILSGGTIQNGYAFTIVSDTVITWLVNTPPNSGTWVIHYTQNNGVSWVTTGTQYTT